MKKTAKLCLTLFLITVALSTVLGVSAQSLAISNAENENLNAYLAILDASNAGANVDELILQLNQAIDFTAKAKVLMNTDIQQAEALAFTAQHIAIIVANKANLVGQSALGTFPFIEILMGVSFMVLGIVIFLFVPKIYRLIVIRSRGSYIIDIIKKESNVKRVCAVIMGIMFLFALISVSGLLVPIEQGESFSELGILSQNKTMDNYPSQTGINQTIHLYGYVGNHMGEPMLYTVLAKLGDNQTVENPALTQPFEQYSRVVSNNQNWTFPIDISLSKPGINQRIIFELWAYNQTLNHNQYQNIYGHININVIDSPP